MKQNLSNKLFSVWDAEMYELTRYYEGLDIYLTMNNFWKKKISSRPFFKKKVFFLA